MLEAEASASGVVRIEFDRMVGSEPAVLAALSQMRVWPRKASKQTSLAKADQALRILQNVFICLGVVALLVPSTILGLGIGPAVAMHEGSTPVVVLNALRLLAHRDNTARAPRGERRLSTSRQSLSSVTE